MSFFCPSPTANSGGVEEGHRVTTWVPFLLLEGIAGETLAPNQMLKGRCTMSFLVLLDVAKAQQAERIRQAERERMLTTALQSERQSVLKSILRSLTRG